VKLAAVVAHDRGRGIGKGGRMPWHLPGDMRYFVSVTTAGEGTNAVIMGRKTYESIPERFRPLRDRRNIVLSRRAGLRLDGAECVATLQEALERAASCPRAFAIGGGEIYRLCLPHCDELFVTRIDAEFDCDTFFPEYDSAFHLSETQGEGCDGGISYRFERWNRNES
jgi:dihydrofolate reductase